ncbi:hypothetical protein DL771_008874 [Monosporascus sp. 5C6A]|nr:hypothetical protein DL771_008874 [Monosporascus sp. 5C6A]
MASQQVLFAETIIAMKKARKRKAYESDSDSEVQTHGNRGQKLKKRARFTRQGQLAPPSGPEVYREASSFSPDPQHSHKAQGTEQLLTIAQIVNHAGYERAIISRNPPLVDDEGYELDSDDDEAQIQEALDTAAEFNPYANVRLENILSPLTTVTDLPTHPTLSRPYKTKTLTQLAEQGCNIMQKENNALWRVKHLQTKLMGDHTWIPCDVMLGPNDLDLYSDDYLERINQSKGSQRSDASVHTLENGQGERSTNGKASTNGEAAAGRVEDSAVEGGGPGTADVTMVDAEPPEREKGADEQPKGEVNKNGQEDVPGKASEDDSNTNTEEKTTNANGERESENTAKVPAGNPLTNGATVEGGHSVEVDDGVDPQSRQAQRGVDDRGSRPPSMSPAPTEDLTIHPLFLAPRSAHPDRDLGLPGDEAEDIRRLLQLYVQKQEEVCRGAKRLYEGLLRADRMRKTVLQWAKYEAHVGPNRDMSDGEDWYDKEEWGLEEDLKKGQDEEEEDTTQPAKKTRTRR